MSSDTSLLSRDIILVAMVGSMALAGAFGMAILVFSPDNIAIGAALVGGAVSAPMAFIAGRKKA